MAFVSEAGLVIRGGCCDTKPPVYSAQVCSWEELWVKPWKQYSHRTYQGWLAKCAFILTAALLGSFSLHICCVLIAQSFLTLCDPMDCSPPDSSVHEILQPRILEWVAIYPYIKQPLSSGLVSLCGQHFPTAISTDLPILDLVPGIYGLHFTFFLAKATNSL